MKRLIQATLEKLFGYSLVRTAMWRETGEKLSQAAYEISLSNERLNRIATLEAQIAAFAPTQAQLTECSNERTSLKLQLERSQQTVRALKHLKDEAEEIARQTRQDLANGDTTGRVETLENENALLRRRIADLDTYLKETRGHAMPYL